MFGFTVWHLVCVLRFSMLGVGLFGLSFKTKASIGGRIEFEPAVPGEYTIKQGL